MCIEITFLVAPYAITDRFLYGTTLTRDLAFVKFLVVFTLTDLAGQFALRTDRLREARERLGWSQRELARRCGIGEVQINRYEKGQSDPSSSYLKLIAEVLGVSANYLLGLTDESLDHVDDTSLASDERAMVDAYRRAGWPGVARLMAEMMEK